MTEALPQFLPPIALAALAVRLWLRARRAERELAERDVRQRALLSQMVQLAERDPLTGLANRRAFDRELSQLAASGAHGALVVIDLDGFKQVNDRFGHQRGDAVLRDVARELRRRVGAGGAVYHRGEKVVDLWGGYRDRARTRPWEEDTLVVVYSTSKGMAATTVAVAHARGLLDYDE